MNQDERQFIQRLVEAAPPLTANQREQIATILRNYFAPALSELIARDSAEEEGAR